MVGEDSIQKSVAALTARLNSEELDPDSASWLASASALILANELINMEAFPLY